MKRTILILFASLLCVFAQAQKENFTQTIRGIVVDADNEQPIPGASIVLIDSNPQIGTSTDLNGEFKLENVPLGRKSINVSGIGYNPSRISNLNLEVGKEIVLTISLKEQIIVSEEVVVTGKSQKNQAHNNKGPGLAEKPLNLTSE